MLAVHRSSIDVHFVGWSAQYDTTIESSDYKQRIARKGAYSEEVVQYSCCMLCDEGGDSKVLVCCDGCPQVLHLQCLKLKQPPKDDYFCPECVNHKRGKRKVKDSNDPAHLDEDEDDKEDEQRADERGKENRTTRAPRSTSASRAVRAPRKALSARSASPAASATSMLSTAQSRSSDARPSDRRALATKAGKPRLADGAGLVSRGQRGAQQEVESSDDDDVMEVEVAEMKEQPPPPPTRKRARNDDGAAEQVAATTAPVGRRTRTTANSAPSPPSPALPPVPPLIPAPSIHLAAGVSSSANQSSRKRVRAAGTQQQQQQQLQQQQEADNGAMSSPSQSDEEKKETAVADEKKPVGSLSSFVDCYRFHASHRGRSNSSTSSSASSSSFTAVPVVGIPPFSFPPSNFEQLSGDAYIAHFCSLLDQAADKVNLNVPGELPGMQRWERMREKMEEVGDWMMGKCNQQINGEQATVTDGNQIIERQTRQWKEQLERGEQRLKETTAQREAAVKEIEAIDQQIEQLRRQREQKTNEKFKRDHELSQLNNERQEAKREFDRKVSEQEANMKKAAHRVRMLHDLQRHVSARREEGDEKEQTGHFWEPLDTIRRRCFKMTAASRVREVDRSNSNSSLRSREEVKEQQQPADEQKEARPAELHQSAAAILDCVNVANFTNQSVRHSQERDGYPLSSFVGDGYLDDVEAAVEQQSGDVPTALLDGPATSVSSLFPPAHVVQLSSASFSGTLSSVSSASTLSEVPHVVLSSGSEDSVSSTQSTLPLSPSQQPLHHQQHGELPLDGWKVQRMQHQRQLHQPHLQQQRQHEQPVQLAEEQKEAENKEEEKQPAEEEEEVNGGADIVLEEVANTRRLSMDVLTAAAEEEFTPEKRNSTSATM